MSESSPVYWVKALGPSKYPITVPNLWLLKLASSVFNYVTQAYGFITEKGKILVVWSSQSKSSHFGQAVYDICLTA